EQESLDVSPAPPVPEFDALTQDLAEMDEDAGVARSRARKRFQFGGFAPWLKALAGGGFGTIAGLLFGAGDNAIALLVGGVMAAVALILGSSRVRTNPNADAIRYIMGLIQPYEQRLFEYTRAFIGHELAVWEKQYCANVNAALTEI